MTEQRGLVRTATSAKRVRIVFGGVVVADSPDAVYVWEGPHYPQYYLPLSDVADGVLEPTATEKRSPSRGIASHFTVRAGGREAIDAAWAYGDSPIEELRGLVRFEWSAMDAWFEEDEEIFVHPRDPAARIQILPSSRRVVVEIGGAVVAASVHPTFLHETHLPRRTYLPKLDVRMDLFVASTTTSMCPYKGTASYWSLGQPDEADIAWSYPAPYRESMGVAGLVAFYDTRVDLTIDGVRQPRPAR